MTTSYPITISANTALSNAITFSKQETPVMLLTPQGWEPAVNLTILVSVDGTNYFNLMNPDGTPFLAVVTPGTAILLENQLQWITGIMLQSGTLQNPTPQLQDRVFQVITNP